MSRPLLLLSVALCVFLIGAARPAAPRQLGAGLGGATAASASSTPNSIDADGDGHDSLTDCDDFDREIWAVPTEVRDLRIVHDLGTGLSSLQWNPPEDPGGVRRVFYDTLVSPSASDFDSQAECLETNGLDLGAIHGLAPPSGASSSFLVRAENACGPGTLGSGPGGAPRIGRPCAIPAPAVYFYDFETGSTDWALDSAWTWVPLDGNHLLRGSGTGFAALTAHTGEVSALRFRFRLDTLQTHLHANVRESWPNFQHARYAVYFSTGGVRISRQEAGSMQLLGAAQVPIAPVLFHEARILVGNGSVDVSIDGERVLGVDDPIPLPAGRVSFGALGPPVVYVDDVEVRIGPEPIPHELAPRPVSSMPPGPDVGPFTGGVHTGSFTLSGDDVLTLSEGRYTLEAGTVTIRDRARMVIEAGAVLIFDRGTSPLLHWGFDLQQEGQLQILGGGILSENCLVRVNAFGTSAVTISEARPWIHFINAGGQSSVEIVNSRFVTDIGGIVTVSGQTSAAIRNSAIGGLALGLQASDVVVTSGLGPGWFEDFDLQRDWTGSSVGFNVRLNGVELVPDTIGEGPYERGWVIFVDERTVAEITDSTLRKLCVSYQPTGGSLEIRGLRLSTPTNLRLGNTRIGNVVVTGQWGFTLRGSRQAAFEDCHALWFFLYDTADVLLRSSIMNEFDPREYFGTLTFEGGSWIMAGEIIRDGGSTLDNDFLMVGTYSTDDGVRTSLSWENSTVTRRYPIVAPDHPDMTITLTRGTQLVTTTTDAEGRATVDLPFTDADYTTPWVLTTSDGHRVEVDFFSTTPLELY